MSRIVGRLRAVKTKFTNNKARLAIPPNCVAYKKNT
jgi:hypothetical protein